MSSLKRTIGIPGATLIGLASMIGTGVFAAWSPAYSLAGSALLIALLIAALMALRISAGCDGR